jgi:hypothetical protein
VGAGLAVGALEIGAAIWRVATGQRALEPPSKLAATRWVAERVFIEGCPGFSDDAAYREMDFPLDALDEIAAEVFSSVAHLLNLDVDVVFVGHHLHLLGAGGGRRAGRGRRPGRRRR